MFRPRLREQPSDKNPLRAVSTSECESAPAFVIERIPDRLLLFYKCRSWRYPYTDPVPFGDP